MKWTKDKSNTFYERINNVVVALAWLIGIGVSLAVLWFFELFT